MLHVSRGRRVPQGHEAILFCTVCSFQATYTQNKRNRTQIRARPKRPAERAQKAARAQNTTARPKRPKGRKHRKTRPTESPGRSESNRWSQSISTPDLWISDLLQCSWNAIVPTAPPGYYDEVVPQRSLNALWRTDARL